MKGKYCVEHASSVGEVPEVELNLRRLGVRNQSHSAVSTVQAGGVQHKLEDEVQFALNVVRVQVVGLVQNDCKVDILATRCRNTKYTK